MIKATVTADVTGLVTLRGTALRKAQRIAMNKAASPVKAAAVANTLALGKKGNLSRSLRIKSKILDNGRAWVVIGASSKFKRSGGRYKRGPKKGQARPPIFPRRYAQVVEIGGPHNTPKTPLERAANSTTQQYIQIYCDEVTKAIKDCSK